MWHTNYGEGFDPVIYHHHQYWDEGFFPAIILLPFAAIFNLFGHAFYQHYLQWLFVIGVAFLVYRLARHFYYSKADSLLLTFGFTLGSAFVGVASVASSWQFAQVITTFLLFASLLEYFTRQRWWLIGTLCGLIFLTRGTAAPVVIFFGLELWTSHRWQTLKYLPLVLPLAVAIGIQALYNFLRFHSPFNGGYEYQLLGPSPSESRAYGVFSIKHIPANAYSLLMGTPNVVTITNTGWTLKFPYLTNNWNGMSIFITSPYFLSLFSYKWKSYNKTARHLLVAALVSCFTVLCFYGIGRNQLGYRYSLDFLPELFVVFMMIYHTEHQRLSNGMKFLLIAGSIFNFYLLMSFI